MKRLAEIAAVSVIGIAAIVWMNLPSDAEVAGRPVGDPSVLLGETMGTTYRVVVPGVTDPALSAQLKEGIDTRLEGINRLMSTWRPDSEISRFNTSEAVDHPIPISQETFGVIAAADLIKQFTGGAFDVSVAPVVSLWSFGPDRRPRAVPTDDAIAAARELVGDVGISIVPGEFGLTKTAPGSAIDLSAIAKGYGVDAIGRLLDDVGLTNWLVEIGGEVRVHGPSGRGDPWRVGIDEPISGERSVRRVVGLPVGDLAALATSGDYRNFFEEDGVRYSHVIDPRTGRPARTDLVSASVLAHDCMTADAFATACLVVGPDDAYDLLIERGLEGCLIVATDDGFETRTTPGFPEKLSPPSPPTP